MSTVARTAPSQPDAAAATRTASRPPAGCCSRSPATPPSTGSPALAARLLGTGHAKVTLFTDQDIVVGGLRAAAGRGRRPGAADRRAVGDRRAPPGRPLDIPDARPRTSAVADLPAVTSGQVQRLPGVAADRGVRPRRRRRWPSTTPSRGPGPTTTRSCWSSSAASVVAELELSAAQSAVGTSLARLEVALEASSIGIWERDLRTGVVVLGQALRGDLRRWRAPWRSRPGRPDADRARPPRGPGAVQQAHAGARSPSARPVHRGVPRSCASDGGVRWVVSRGRVVGDAAGEPVRILGTVLDVTDARQQAEPRLVGAPAGDRDRRGGRRAGQRRADRGPRRHRAARREGAGRRSPARWRSSTSDGGPLRLHMTRRLADEVQEPRRLPRRGHRDRARRRAAHPVRGHARPPRAAGLAWRRCWPASRRPGRACEVLGVQRARRPAAAGRGPGARVVRRDLGDRRTPSPTTTSRCSRRWPPRSR